MRDRVPRAPLERPGYELHEGDVLRPETLRGAGEGIDVAYYLVHSMGRGGGGDFARARARRRRGVRADGAREGVERVVYLGGLGDEPELQAPAQPPRDGARARASTARR